jgi:hypothetical protein
MTGYLMNPVNRQYFEVANLFVQAVLVGKMAAGRASGGSLFKGVATGIPSASGHFNILVSVRL